MRLQLLQAIEQQELMDEQRKREIGARIKDLREASPYTQAAAAGRVGVTLRAFQKWEQGRGITYENVERVATVFDVEPDYILKGPAPTPFRSGADSMPSLQEVEELLREVLSRLDALERIQGRLERLDEDARKTWTELAAHDMEVMSRLDEVEKTIRGRSQQEPPR